ncbi:MAG: phosphoserine phosphatase SerB [Pseudomonadota bacterium]|nr:phosphoserine phosphatase SerB [Pseudomonadota bacterium]
MKFVATLIANPEKANLHPRDVKQAREILKRAGYTLEHSAWLKDCIACDIEFTGSNLSYVRNCLRIGLNSLEIDVVVQPTKNRRKRVLIADMDSTIVTGETLDELAEIAGLKNQVSIITERAMRGEVDFKDAVRERVALLKGVSAKDMKDALNKIEVTSGAPTLVKTMRFNGAYTALVSGGFSYFTSAIAKLVGFQEEISNQIVIQNGILTGEVIEPILDSDSKLQALKKICNEKHIPLSESIATGDGANDIPMIIHSGLGVAFHAKPAVETNAKAIIRFGDLTSLLYIQGYKSTEFCY